MIEPTADTRHHVAGDLVERALPFLIGAAMAIWLALAVVGGVRHAMLQGAAAIEAATATHH